MRNFGMDVQFTDHCFTTRFPMMCIMDDIHIYLIMGGEVEALSLGRTTNGDPLMWHLYNELLFKVLL